MEGDMSVEEHDMEVEASTEHHSGPPSNNIVSDLSEQIGAMALENDQRGESADSEASTVQLGVTHMEDLHKFDVAVSDFLPKEAKTAILRAVRNFYLQGKSTSDGTGSNLVVDEDLEQELFNEQLSTLDWSHRGYRELREEWKAACRAFNELATQKKKSLLGDSDHEVWFTERFGVLPPSARTIAVSAEVQQLEKLLAADFGETAKDLADQVAVETSARWDDWVIQEIKQDIEEHDKRLQRDIRDLEQPKPEDRWISIAGHNEMMRLHLTLALNSSLKFKDLRLKEVEKECLELRKPAVIEAARLVFTNMAISTYGETFFDSLTDRERWLGMERLLHWELDRRHTKALIGKYYCLGVLSKEKVPE